MSAADFLPRRRIKNALHAIGAPDDATVLILDAFDYAVAQAAAHLADTRAAGYREGYRACGERVLRLAQETLIAEPGK